MARRPTSRRTRQHRGGQAGGEAAQQGGAGPGHPREREGKEPPGPRAGERQESQEAEEGGRAVGLLHHPWVRPEELPLVGQLERTAGRGQRLGELGGLGHRPTTEDPPSAPLDDRDLEGGLGAGDHPEAQLGWPGKVDGEGEALVSSGDDLRCDSSAGDVESLSGVDGRRHRRPPLVEVEAMGADAEPSPAERDGEQAKGRRQEPPHPRGSPPTRFRSRHCSEECRKRASRSVACGQPSTVAPSPWRRAAGHAGGVLERERRTSRCRRFVERAGDGAPGRPRVPVAPSRRPCGGASQG